MLWAHIANDDLGGCSRRMLLSALPAIYLSQHTGVGAIKLRKTTLEEIRVKPAAMEWGRSQFSVCSFQGSMRKRTQGQQGHGSLSTYRHLGNAVT